MRIHDRRNMIDMENWHLSQIEALKRRIAELEAELFLVRADFKLERAISDNLRQDLLDAIL